MSGKIRKEMTKSLPITKRMVYNSYLKVRSKRESAGIDRESISMFESNLSSNLYKLWNRMSSGSYFPPAVKTVFISKKQGGERALGIPTVSNRIAQSVVKEFLEPHLESVFHSQSYGYRPGKSAHDAVAQCLKHCRSHAWVIDVDIKGFFDHLNHDLMLSLLKGYGTGKWVLLYVSRWIKVV